MNKLIVPFLASILFMACNTYNGIILINQIPNPVTVTFQGYHDIDTSNYSILGKENKTIMNNVFSPGQREREVELKSIIVKIDSTKKYRVLRFSNSFLEINNWMLGIPFPVSNSMKYEPWSLTEKVDGLNSHSYYHFVQALYNAGKYEDCIKAVEDIAPLFTTRDNQVQRNPPKSETIQKVIDVQEIGLLTLAYFSAIKLNEPTKIEYYWSAIKNIDIEFTNYLQKNDFEIVR